MKRVDVSAAADSCWFKHDNAVSSDRAHRHTAPGSRWRAKHVATYSRLQFPSIRLVYRGYPGDDLSPAWPQSRHLIIRNVIPALSDPVESRAGGTAAKTLQATTTDRLRNYGNQRLTGPVRADTGINVPVLQDTDSRGPGSPLVWNTAWSP